MKRAASFYSILIIALLMAVMCSGCKEEDTLKIGLLPNEEVLPFYVALEEDLYQKHGVNVEVVNFQSAAERDAALQAGAVDGVEGDLLAVALIRQGGTPVKAVSLAMGATPQEGRFALLAAPGTITDVKELKGKKLAISENTIIEYTADQMLLIKGIDPQEVQKVNIAKMPLRAEMLLQKQVDAAVLPDPLAAYAEIKGANVLIDDTKLGVNISQSVYFFSDEAIETKKEAIKKFLQAYAEGSEILNENPEGYRDLFIEKIQIPVELQESYPVPSFSTLQLPAQEDTQRVIDWLTDNGLLTEPYTYEDIVTDEVIK
ncbi:MAG: MetQ/NlpA family ABC transporter substrate-binding protein [Syntrophaceticus sp.]|nr:MetQ/NlpA family ABC transporter substrate-binding protein [Syntrophaceticus sp.]MDD3313966.1 MetQ/NlpA family ABC transporter substrate-binding protein [Syntrophaceticus sp.]MDD4359043.1 MetQ/NlpA family ABC transporter substrate-binding protein [Syntrophaceticus sp.]MDD4782641.1 MetQ/NlpA family ABC transporter substrate-binding protein [Syntrophaceticus sp.]